jgi:mannose-1-phosphate guanylyltransferase
MRALLLAAGLGTRLRPLTNYWPKCLMPIGGRPLLQYWLELMIVSGVEEVLVNKHYHNDIVTKFLDQKRYLGWVKSVYEINLLGTAGTLRENAKFFLGAPTILIHADNWCQCNFDDFIKYHQFYRPKDCLITMMTFNTESPQNCGIVKINDKGVVIGFYEKVSNPPGNCANAAVYILEPEIIEWIQNEKFISDFSTEVLPHFMGRIATWNNTGIHRDIGTLKSLLAAQSDPILQNDLPMFEDWQMEFEKTIIYNSLTSM